MEKYKKLFSNTAIFGVSTILSKLVLSLLLPLYTRFLTTGQYGTAELITSITQLLIPICSLAIQDAVFRFGMDKEYKHEDVIKTSIIATGIGIVGLLFSSLLLKLYAPVAEWTHYLFWISILTMIRTQLDLYAKAIDKTLIFALDNIVYNISLGILNIVFLTVFRLELSGYFFAIITANTLSILFLVSSAGIFKDIRDGSVSLPLFRSMLAYSAPLILNSISWGITHLTDKIMLTNYCSSGATGLYSAASKIPSLLSLVTGVFCSAWTLSAIRDYQEERDYRFYENIFFITHIGVVMISIAVFIVNNTVLLWIIGDAFAESIKYVPVLIIATVFLTYVNFYTPIYSALKKSTQLMYSSILGMIINVIMNALLIPIYGIMGACIATALSYACIALFRAINSSAYMKINIEPRRWAVSLALVITAGVLTVLQKNEVLFALASAAVIFILYKNRIMQVVRKIIRR